MPQSVEIPGHGTAEFPDDMSPDAIKGVIQQKFYSDQKPAEAPRSLRESLGRFLGAAQDFGKGAFSDYLPPEVSQTLFGGSASGMRAEEHTGQVISPELATKIVGELPAYAGGNTDAARGVAAGAARKLSEFSNPEALAQLPAFAVPGVGETYLANIIAGVPKQAEKLGAIAGEHGIASKEFAQAATEAGIVDLTGVAAGLHSPAVKEARLSESLRPLIGGEEPAAVLSDRLPETTLSPEAIAETRSVVEPPRNKNQPVEPEGGSAVAQGDLDALTRSNAERLGLSTEGLPAEMPTAPAAAVEPRTITGPVLTDAANNVMAETVVGKTHADITPEALPKFMEANPEADPFSMEHQFRASDGSVLPRTEAWDVAKESGQIKPEILARKEASAAKEGKPPELESQDLLPANEATRPAEPIQAAGATVGETNVSAAPNAGGSEIAGAEAAAVPEAATASVGPEPSGEYRALSNQSKSWILRNKDTKEVIMETSDPKKLKALNTDKYEAVPITDYLYELNGSKVGEPATESLGPGAASITEPLASYEQRRFGKRLQEDATISPEVRAQTGNQYYEAIPNTVTVKDAADIIETRGTDESVRIVRDESVAMPPRVRVTVGEALIKKLNQSYEEATKAGDAGANEFLQQAVDTAEFLSGYGTTLGQGVQAFAIWNKLTPEGRLLEATRIAQKSGIELKPEQIKKINQFNAEIEKAPEGFQKDEKTQDLLSYMADLKGVKPADIPTALWYSNILSGYSTQLVNTIDTALNVFSEAATMGIANPKSIPNIVAGLYRGMINGGFEAASVLKTGRSITGDKISQQRILERTKFGEKGGVPMSEATPIGRFMKSAFESKPATILNLWKYPLRAMIASDTVFFNSMKEARAQYLARGIAKKEGLSGKALFKRVENELNQSPETIEAATRQAQAEGLTGLDVKRRTAEIIDQGRSEALVADANEAAAIATYNHDPSGVLGLVAQNISNITEGFPLGKAVVPFTRIVANVANRGLNYTPWGYKRAFFGEWGGKKFATEPPTGDAFKAQLVKATLGTTAMTAVALLDANDTIQVTAKGPDNPDEAKQLQNAGWKPYSVKVGDTYYSYQYTPMNLGFAMIGHYRDAVRYNKLSEKDAQTRLAYGMLKSGSTIFDMSFLSGISDFVSSVQGNTSSTKGAGRLFSRTASSVLIPNLVKQIDKLFDPTIYQADTITQSLVRETPIARSTALKPMLNVLGEPIKPSQNRFFTFETDDPVWKFITENQAWIPVPSKTSKIGDRPITPEEYYTLIKESGPMIRDYIESNLGRLQSMTGEEAQKEIRKESERARNVVKSRF